jgi:hypothetical protein
MSDRHPPGLGLSPFPLLFKDFGDTLVKSAALFFEIERGRQDLHR